MGRKFLDQKKKWIEIDFDKYKFDYKKTQICYLDNLSIIMN